MNVVITGANRGIGLALTKHYSKTHRVFALCRQASDALLTLPGVDIVTGVDVCDQASIDSAVSQCSGTVDILINNAGILDRVTLDDMNEQTMLTHWNVNAMGPIRVTTSFRELLRKGSKVIMMSSRMGSIEDNDSGSHYAYRMSKAALNMAAKSMAIDFKDAGILVGIIHPGWVQTDMTGHTGHYDVDIAATQIMDRIHDLNETTSGQFFHSNGDRLSW